MTAENILNLLLVGVLFLVGIVLTDRYRARGFTMHTEQWVAIGLAGLLVVSGLIFALWAYARPIYCWDGWFLGFIFDHIPWVCRW